MVSHQEWISALVLKNEITWNKLENHGGQYFDVCYIFFAVWIIVIFLLWKEEEKVTSGLI